MKLKWGVASTGTIAHDFVTAVQTFSSSNHEFVAVAARSKSDAAKFASDHRIPKAYEGYLALARDVDIQIVHVGTIVKTHFEITKMMLEHGKHVLCEKPLAMNKKQTEELCRIAKDKKLFFMEGVWSRCFPAIIELERILNDKVIGDVKLVRVDFGQDLKHLDRLLDPNLGGGATPDLGIYVLQFQQYIFKPHKISTITVNGHKTQTGVDESVAITITYPKGKIASLTVSLATLFPNEGLIVGTNGWIKIPDFWCPTKLIFSNGDTREFPLPKVEGPRPRFFCHNSEGLAYEADEIRRCLMKGQTEYSRMTMDDSIELAGLIDYVRKEMDVIFPEDSI